MCWRYVNEKKKDRKTALSKEGYVWKPTAGMKKKFLNVPEALGNRVTFWGLVCAVEKLKRNLTS